MMVIEGCGLDAKGWLESCDLGALSGLLLPEGLQVADIPHVGAAEPASWHKMVSCDPPFSVRTCPSFQSQWLYLGSKHVAAHLFWNSALLIGRALNSAAVQWRQPILRSALEHDPEHGDAHA